MVDTLRKAFKDLSVLGYDDTSFRICMCLQAYHIMWKQILKFWFLHILMWDVMENGPTGINERTTIVIEGTSLAEAAYAKS